MQYTGPQLNYNGRAKIFFGEGAMHVWGEFTKYKTYIAVVEILVGGQDCCWDKVLIYLSSYLDQEAAKEPFRSSSQAATSYFQFNHLKVDAIP